MGLGVSCDDDDHEGRLSFSLRVIGLSECFWVRI